MNSKFKPQFKTTKSTQQGNEPEFLDVQNIIYQSHMSNDQDQDQDRDHQSDHQCHTPQGFLAQYRVKSK